MPTDPLLDARYPASSAVPNVNQDIQNAVIDISSKAISNHATTTERDNDWAAWVALGNSMRNGLRSIVNGVPYRRINATWRIDRDRIFERVVTIGGGGTIASGGAAETGVTAGYTALGTFTVYEQTVVKAVGHFRANPGAGAGGCMVKINGAQVGYSGVVRSDVNCTVVGTVSLAAGTYSVAARIDAVGATVTWTEGRVILSTGSVE